MTAHGQWVTEQYQLKAGWNAVYFHIDASHATLSELIGSDADNPIEEIWLWTPPGPALQFFDSLQAPQSASTEWLRWDRYWAGAPPMQRLVGNAAALVRVADGAPDYIWTLVGKPMPPARNWTSSGMNFIGFSTPRTNPPVWGNFLGPARSLHDHAEIYRYVGGPFSATNPQRIFPPQLRNTPLHRNQAYWVRSEDFNRYFGAFEVKLEQTAGLHFGDRRGQYRLRLRNRIDESVTVQGTLAASLPTTTGSPVVVRVYDNENNLQSSKNFAVGAPLRIGIVLSGEPPFRVNVWAPTGRCRRTRSIRYPRTSRRHPIRGRCRPPRHSPPGVPVPYDFRTFFSTTSLNYEKEGHV